jgi:predicted ester cyclase
MTTPKDTILHRWYEEVWHKGNASAIDEMFDPDVRIHGLIDAYGNEVSSAEDFKRFHQTFLNVFSDTRVIVEETVSEGDKLVARCVVKQTHTGEGLGISPTNKALEYTGMCMVRLEGGKIVEAWNNFDYLTMFRQLGVASFPLA